MPEEKGITTITIMEKEIPIFRNMLAHADLKFFPENPRVYSIVHQDGEDDPDQDLIERELQKMEHVKQLIQAIRQNGGLTDPLLVRGSDNVVLEGNSRLAAYRHLSKTNPVQWGKVKCDVITSAIDDLEVKTLLSSYHIVGRKSWDPFEQAGMFWRWRRQGVSIDEILSRVEKMGISAKKIRHWIEVYSIMVKHRDANSNRWSYYDDLLRTPEIRRVCEEKPKFVEVFVKKVKQGEIKKAVVVRSKLKAVCKAGGRVLNDFVEEKSSLDSCFDRVVAQGGTDALYNRLLRFREMIGLTETKKSLKAMSPLIKKKYRFELSQIHSHAERLLKSLDED